MKKIICLIWLLSITTFSKATCGLTGTAYNSSQNIFLDPMIPVGVNSYYIQINYGDSLMVYISATGGAAGCDLDSVSWTYNGNLIGQIQNNIFQDYFTINDSGLYILNFLFDGSMPIQCNFYITYNPLLVELNKNINFLNVFPTAVTSSITIQLNSIKSNDIEISFFDMHGRQLKNDFYKNVFGEFIKNENTEALAKGIYFLRIKTGEDMVEKKFVKM